MNQEGNDIRTANINNVKDSIEIIRHIYHMPDADSHVHTLNYVENVQGMPADEIFKLTHAEFADLYTRRDFMMDYPAGFLVEKLDEHLARTNRRPTRIEYGNWPTIKWLKEMIR